MVPPQWEEEEETGGPGRRAATLFFISPLWSCLSESEVPGAGVAVVVELLLDVDHVAAGVLQLSELGTATQVQPVAELGEPRPRRGVWRERRHRAT